MLSLVATGVAPGSLPRRIRRAQAFRHHNHAASLVNTRWRRQQVAPKLKATRIVARPARPTALASTSNNGW